MPTRPGSKELTLHKPKSANSASLACHGLYRFPEGPLQVFFPDLVDDDRDCYHDNVSEDEEENDVHHQIELDG